MLQGQTIYRDFFELTLPGAQWVYLALFKILGVRAWIPNLTFVALGMVLVWAGIVISKSVTGGTDVFLPSLLFLAFAFTSEPDPTHRWFSSVFVMPALAVLMAKRDRWRLALAGVFCGVATLFTQTTGVAAAAGIAAFLLWEWRAMKPPRGALMKSTICLAAGFLAVTLSAWSYLVSEVGWQRLVYCTIVFPLKYFSRWYWNTSRVYLSEVPDLTGLLEIPALGIWLFIYFIVPGVYLLFFARWRRAARARQNEPWDRLMLVTLVGVFLFFSVATSASWLRLCSVSLPALIVLVWLLQSSGTTGIAIAKGLGAAALLTLVAQSLIVQTSAREILDSRVGRMAILDSDRFEKFKWVQDHTRQGDFFFQASDCDMYYPLGLRNPAPVQFLTASGYTRPEQVREVVDTLEATRTRFVLWSVWLDVPLHPGYFADVLAPIRPYLGRRYHLVRNFGAPDYEQVWERNGE